MVKIIMGEKGTGKTKKLVDLVRDAVDCETGDVVVIEKDKKLTYDIPYQARLIDAAEYPIGDYEFIKGLICGIHAGNYDITHIFIDNFKKLVKDNSAESFDRFIEWLVPFSDKDNIEFVISFSSDPETASDKVKALLINH